MSGEPGHVWDHAAPPRRTNAQREAGEPAYRRGPLICVNCRELWPGTGPCMNREEV